MEIGLGENFGGQEMQLRSSAITYNTAVSVCQETDMERCFLFDEFLDEAVVATQLGEHPGKWTAGSPQNQPN